ncbi:MAG: hypothetical protein V7756_06020 [Halopseudomonas sp.]|uniref:DUF7693 family protein n=1 Tax=Halopseudomonas sp. TaxID=2901191 RepID=UPI0030037317
MKSVKSAKLASPGPREVYQLLRNVALGLLHLERTAEGSWTQVHTGSVRVQIEGHLVWLVKESGSLDHCLACQMSDGRRADQSAWAQPGTDPLELLSVWERAQLMAILESS